MREAPVRVSGVSLEELRRVRGLIEEVAEKRLGRYGDDPVGFVTDVLEDHLWSKQREIVESVRDHRRTAVPACHGPGKSFTAARLVAWWLATHAPGDAFVVTTAPTFPQVRAILWREIGRAFRQARTPLPGRINQTEWWIGDELVAFGRKPSDTDESAFQGIHARHVLVILDEASGVPASLWTAADTLTTTPGSRMLAIGNPDDPTGPFAEACATGSGWNVIPIDAFDTPNFTGESVPPRVAENLTSKIWVDEKRDEWGEDSPLWTSKVRGRFPASSEWSLVSIPWVVAAEGREPDETGETRIAIDVARFGSDETVAAVLRGNRIEILRTLGQSSTDTVVALALRLKADTGATEIVVDGVGVGAGVVDELRAAGEPVVDFGGGERATDPDRYLNRRAEAFWTLRTGLEEGAYSLAPDPVLAGQLVDLRYKFDRRGRIAIETKDELRRRGRSSPDRADAVSMLVSPRRRAEWAVG